MTWLLWLITIIALIASQLKDPKKTKKILYLSGKRLISILPLFLFAMIGYALIIGFTETSTIQKIMGHTFTMGHTLMATLIGSIALLPGFIAFPLCALLQKQGVAYGILAAFSISLMNVGIATFPIEVKYLGFKVSLIRNILGLLMASVCGLIMAFFMGELL